MAMAGYGGDPAVAGVAVIAEIVVDALKVERERCLWVHPQIKRDQVIVGTLTNGGGAVVIVGDNVDAGDAGDTVMDGWAGSAGVVSVDHWEDGVAGAAMMG